MHGLTLVSSVSFLLAVVGTLSRTTVVEGHGYLFEPASRNYWSNVHGKDYGLERGLPSPREYCFHCLNTNTGVCGTSEQGVNYDDWLDSVNEPMPWLSTATYQAGESITLGVELKSHHLGHMEVRGCPVAADDATNGRASVTQDCFDAHVLEFIEDVSYQMPKDENHPERGYFYGGVTFSSQEFMMRFRLPASLSGDKVLLQWFYYTANSCSPEGYYDYFARKNTELPESFWGGPTLPTCTDEQFPARGKPFFTGDSPERFVNCAEVTIEETDTGSGGGDDRNNNTPAPTTAPSTASVDTTSPPSTAAPPINNNIFDPAPTTTDETTSSIGAGCCSNDWKTCATWCNASQNYCENSTAGECMNMKWLSNGSLENSPDSTERTCAPRWSECGGVDNGNNSNSCCDGLVCQVINDYFRQCLHPNDPILV